MASEIVQARTKRPSFVKNAALTKDLSALWFVAKMPFLVKKMRVMFFDFIAYLFNQLSAILLVPANIRVFLLEMQLFAGIFFIYFCRRATSVRFQGFPRPYFP